MMQWMSWGKKGLPWGKKLFRSSLLRTAKLDQKDRKNLSDNFTPGDWDQEKKKMKVKRESNKKKNETKTIKRKEKGRRSGLP